MIPVGAKLGAILCGFVWMALDPGGIETLLFRPVWTDMGAYGYPWTARGDLRIRRLGVRVPPGVPLKPLGREGFRLSTGQLDNLWTAVWSASGPRELGPVHH